MKDLTSNSFAFIDVIVSDGELPPLTIIPVFPLTLTSGLTLLDDYVMTRFIGGMDGEVIFSKPLMSKK